MEGINSSETFCHPEYGIWVGCENVNIAIPLRNISIVSVSLNSISGLILATGLVTWIVKNRGWNRMISVSGCILASIFNTLLFVGCVYLGSPIGSFFQALSYCCSFLGYHYLFFLWLQLGLDSSLVVTKTLPFKYSLCYWIETGLVLPAFIIPCVVGAYLRSNLSLRFFYGACVLNCWVGIGFCATMGIRVGKKIINTGFGLKGLTTLFSSIAMIVLLICASGSILLLVIFPELAVFNEVLFLIIWAILLFSTAFAGTPLILWIFFQTFNQEAYDSSSKDSFSSYRDNKIDLSIKS